MDYDINTDRALDTSDDVLADVRHNYKEKLGVYRLSTNAENYFINGFARSIAEAMAGDYKYDAETRRVIRRLLKLACLISVERAFLLRPLDPEITTNDVWFGLVAARWAACPLDNKHGFDPGPEGRWCNFLMPCPPEDPDCPAKFDFAAGKRIRSSK